MRFTSTQIEALRWFLDPNDKRPCFIQGNAGSGKTYIAALGSIMTALTPWGKAPRHFLGGPSIGSIAVNCEPEYEKAATSLGLVATPKGAPRRHVQVAGTQFMEFGAPNVAAQRGVRGPNMGNLSADEATLLPEWFFEESLTRLRLVENPKRCYVFNPDHPDNWVATRFHDKQDPEKFLYLKSDVKESCELGILPWSYWESLDMLTGARRARLRDNEWAAETGLCWPSFPVSRDLPEPEGGPYSKVIAGSDVGTDDPHCTLWWGRRESDEKWELIHEYYWDHRKRGTQRTDTEHVAHIAEVSARLGCTQHRSGHDAANFRTAQQNAGLQGVASVSGKIRDKVNFIEDQLNLGLVIPTVVGVDLVREAMAYVWDERKKDEPLDKNNHACDAMIASFYEVRASFGMG